MSFKRIKLLLLKLICKTEEGFFFITDLKHENLKSSKLLMNKESNNQPTYFLCSNLKDTLEKYKIVHNNILFNKKKKINKNLDQ